MSDDKGGSNNLNLNVMDDLSSIYDIGDTTEDYKDEHYNGRRSSLKSNPHTKANYVNTSDIVAS